jgi:hypothetical protein
MSVIVKPDNVGIRENKIVQSVDIAAFNKI